MSEADSMPEQAQALRRSLSIRIGVALAALVGVAILAIVVLMRSETGAGATPAMATAAPVARTQQPQSEPSLTAPVSEPAPATAPEAADLTSASGSGDAIAAPGAEVDVKESRSTDQAPSAHTKPVLQASRAAVDETAALNAPATPAEGTKEATTSQTDAASSASGAAPGPTAGNKPVRGPRLQAGVFQQASNAQALKANLEAQGFPVSIESRVHIGPFRDRKEAERAREKLRTMGMTTVLIAQ
jgi:cell division protein FtsN